MTDYGGGKLSVNQDRVVWKTIGDEIVFLNLTTQHYYSVNATGARLWHLLLAGKTYDEIIDSFCGEYDVTRPELETQVKELLDDLVCEGFISAR